VADKKMPMGDTGKWNLDSGLPPEKTIKQRVDQGLGVTSPEVVAAMEQERAFIASVNGKSNTRRFTDRRGMVGRTRTTP
jgi:hypothetical protein